MQRHGDGAKRFLFSAPPPQGARYTQIVDYRVQQYYSTWLLFKFSLAAFLCVVDDVDLIPRLKIKACPAGIVLFISLLVATIAMVDPVNDDKHNADTGFIVLAITSALALPLTLHKREKKVPMLMVAHAFVVKALAVSMFVFLTYTGPINTIGNGYFTLIVASLTSIYCFACLLHECCTDDMD